MKVRTIHEYGNASIIAEELNTLLPILKSAFPGSYDEIVALASSRVIGYVPLKRIADVWEKMENALNVHPNCDPKNLSSIIREIGADRSAQQQVFSHLNSLSNQLIYDLSFILSDSASNVLTEKAYVSDGVYLPHYHIALFCGRDSGLPVMIRSLPGSITDVTTLDLALKEIDLRNKILLLDRGFISDKNFAIMAERLIKFVIPLKRDNIHYSTRIHLTGHFQYHKRLIHSGRHKVDNFTLYLFEDEDLALDEKKTLYSRFEKGQISRSELNSGLKKVGRILFLTTVDLPEKDVYELYKSRDMVEKFFNAFKNELMADKVHLHDTEAVFGHLFVSFISLYIYCRMVNRLKSAELLSHFSPHDILTKFSKVYAYRIHDERVISEVPKKVRELSKKLGYSIFPN
jgi:transposase